MHGCCKPGVVVAGLGEYIRPLFDGERPVVVDVRLLEGILLRFVVMTQ